MRPSLSSLRRLRCASARRLLLCALLTAGSFSLFAQTQTVTNTNDSGAGSLRQAIINANAFSGTTAITFQSGLFGTITLQSPLPQITQSMSITGPGSVSLTISGANLYRPFSIASGATVSISAVTIESGVSTTGGGAIFNQGTLTLSSDAILSNIDGETNAMGGAILNAGTLTIDQCIISGGTASTSSGSTSGGGLANQGTATISNSSFTFNASLGGPSAGGRGGAIYNASGATLTMVNTIFSGNEAADSHSAGGGGGGAIYNASSIPVTIQNSTIVNNSQIGASASDSGGGIFTTTGSVTLTNTIVALNTDSSGNAPDLAGAYAGTFNFIGNQTGMTGLTNAANGNQVGTAVAPLDPLLAGLSANLRPNGNSPVLGAGSTAATTVTTDQRGFPRVVNGKVDIGAVQLQGLTVNIGSVTPESAGTGTAFTYPLTVYVTESCASCFATWIPGVSVTFTAPSTGASSIFSNSSNVITGVTTSAGTISEAIIANSTAGGAYTVTASATSPDQAAASSVSFSLTNVADSATRFQAILTNGTSITAGIPFSTTISARDASGALVTNYVGTVHFTKTDAGAGSAVPADYTFQPSDGGSHVFTFTLVTVGSTMTVTDTVNSAITTTFTPAITAAAATHFSMIPQSSAAQGTAFNVVVQPRDQYNNDALSYTGTVHFASGDIKAVLPADSTLISNVTFPFTLNTVGSDTITATDTVNSSITSQATIVVPAPNDYVVSNTNASGAGSLAAAVAAANGDPDGGTIFMTIPIGSTITLTQGLELTQSMSITGPGVPLDASNLTIKTADGSYAFRIHGGITVAIAGLTVQGGWQGISSTGALALSYCAITGATSGGGLSLFQGNATIANCAITGNTGTEGGGVAIGQNVTVTISDSTISNNSSSQEGGGINSQGTLTIIRSTVSNNSSGAGGTINIGGGGGIFSAGWALTITNSTLSGNSVSSGEGGGILLLESSFTMIGSTVTGNTVSGAGYTNGAGIYLYAGSPVIIQNSTIAGNRQLGTNTSIAGDFGGGIVNSAGSVTLANTILAGNTDATGTSPDGNGTFVDGGNNLIGNSAGMSGITNGVNGNIVGSNASPVNPQLGPLRNNGGPTQTVRPNANSPALGAGSTTNAPSTDQRGFPRIVNGKIDIGATQFQGLFFLPNGDTIQTTTVGTPFFAPFMLNVAEECSCTNEVPGLTVTFTMPSTGASGTFSNGTTTITGVTDSQGSVAVTATANTIAGSYAIAAKGTTPDQPLPTTTGFSLTNQSSAPTHLTVSAPSTATTGVPFNVTVNALDQFNNIAIIYNGTVHFASSDVVATLPADSTLPGNGTGTFSVTLNNTGTQTITVTDTLNASLTAQASVSVSAGTSFQVTNSNDSGTGSLRAAITSANANPGFALITFALGSGATITLQSPLPQITGGMSITGGASSITIDGANLYQPFSVAHGAVLEITGITIQHGMSAGPFGGGAILNFDGTVALANCVITGNQVTVGAGGAINNQSGGTLTVNNCTISGNTVSNSPNLGAGGAIANDGTATITNSTVSGNTAVGAAFGGWGGAISTNIGNMTIVGSTIAGNQATDPQNNGSAGGGAIFVGQQGSLTVQNSTISGNTYAGTASSDNGGGIFCNGTCALTNTILAGNTAGNGVAPDGYATNSNSFSGSNNLIGNGANVSGLTNGASGNIVGSSASPIPPALSVLGRYGGPTLTMLPYGNSPALGAGSATNAPSTDQRGYARVVNGKIDIGAVQFQGLTVDARVGTPQSRAVNKAFGTQLTAFAAENNSGADVGFVTMTFTAPSTGPSATFSNGTNTITETTNDVGGISETVTANSIVGGPYNVTASATTPDQASPSSANFVLTNVSGATTHFGVSAPSTTTVGAPFFFTVTALDASNSVVTDYSGSLGGASTFPAKLINGVGTFSATSYTPGTGTIQVYDYNNPAIFGNSNPINVLALTALVVTNTNDSGTGSLRQAIITGNSSGGATISFSVNGTITLLSPLPTITQTMTISGSSAQIIDGAGLCQPFSVASGATVSIVGVTIQHGLNATAGGAISNSGNLSLASCTLTGNQAAVGGAVYNNSTGTLSVYQCTISNNTSQGNGGGIENTGAASIIASTFADNSAVGGSGGAIANLSAGAATLTILNSTFNGNQATDPSSAGPAMGGAIFSNNGGSCTIQNSTIVGNSQSGTNVLDSGGGIGLTNGTCTLTDTILASNSDATGNAPDGAGAFAGSYNLIGNGTGLTGLTNGASGNQVGTGASPIVPALSPLGDYSGPTQTMRPNGNSPVLAAGTAISGTVFDQRGMARTQNAKIDIGAVQLQAVWINLLSGDGQSGAIGAPFANPLAALVGEVNGTGFVPGVPVTFTAPTSGPSGLFSNSSTTITGLTDSNGFATEVFTANSALGGPYTVTASATTPDQATPNVDSFFQLRNVAATTVTQLNVAANSSTFGGVPFNVTVTALDQNGNVVTTYGGTVHFATTDPSSSAVVPANYTFVAGDRGVHTFTNGVTLATSGRFTVTATDTNNSAITAGTASVSVSPSPATHFTVSAPATVTQGQTFSVTVTALTANNFVATGYSGTVHFTKSDSGARSFVPSDYTFQPNDNGVHTFTNAFVLATTGNQTISVNDIVATAITGTSTIAVNAAATPTHFSVSTPTASASGTRFSFTVTSLDSNNNTTTGYFGTIHFTSSDGTATLSADGTLTSGTGTFTATLNALGSQTITATNTVNSSISGQASVNVPTPTSYVVTNTNNSGAGSLADAVAAASIDPNGGAITFSLPNPSTIRVSGTLYLGQSMSVTGPGAGALTIDGAHVHTVFVVNSGFTVSMSGIAIQNGSGTGLSAGGILNSGTLTLNSCLLQGNVNTSTLGAGGIKNTGSLTVNQCLIAANVTNTGRSVTAAGGLFNTGVATLTDTTFYQNLAPTVIAAGSAIYNFGGTLTVSNCTIVANSSSLGGGILSSGGSATLTNTIASNNFASVESDLSGAFSGNNNLIGAAASLTGITDGLNGNRVGTGASPVDPLLGPLANNGGPTRTALPSVNSPALAAGTTANAPATDQRGFARVVNGTIDIGAVQFQGVTLAASAGTPQSTAAGTAFATPLTATATENTSGVAVSGVSMTFTAPSTGPSGTFSNSTNTITATTNASGAIAESFTANATAGGPYNVTAGATTPDQASASTVNFALTNVSAAATHFAVSAPSTIAKGTQFSFTVTALNASNATVTGYTGTVHFTSSGGAAMLPSDSTLTNGTGTFTATLNTIGSQSITAIDTVNSSLSGQAAVNVPAPTSYVVTNTNASGAGSLAAQVAAANADPAGGAITFNLPNPSTITLGATLALTQSITIAGPTGSSVAISGNNAVQVFSVASEVTASISGVTIQNGLAGNLGGGVGNSGTLTLSSCTITGNVAANAGGGISNDPGATLSVDQCTISNNQSHGIGGGGVYSHGAAVITNSTISGNTAVGGPTQGALGGGIANNGGVMTIGGSTIAGNQVSDPQSAGRAFGGGIYSSSGGLVVSNSTIYGNSNTGTRTDSSGDFGGGIYGLNITLSNMIVAGNTAPAGPDAYSLLSFTDGGNNLIGDGTALTGIANGVNGNIVGTSASPISPLLAPLLNNAGFTLTMLPNGNSPVLGAGSTANAPATDQRGFPRVVNGKIDIGAVQFQGVTLSATSGPTQSTEVGTAFELIVTALENMSGQEVPGISVSLTAPSTGPSGTFSNSTTTITATTNASKVVVEEFTANMTPGGPYNVTASATSVDQAAPASVNFALTNIGPVTHFSVSAPSIVPVGSVFSFTVTALDQFNRTVSTYSGTAHFTSTDGSAKLPVNATLLGGMGTFSATLNTIGNQTITATDTVTTSSTGTSGTINVPVPTALVVTNTNDSGTGSLRQAIIAGNASSAGAAITFANGVTGTITLQSALPQISQTMAITGPGASNLIIDGANLYQPFSISQATVSISGVTIQHGFSNLGGAIVNTNGTLTLSSCVFNSNQASAPSGSVGGGAVYNTSTLIVDRCSFTSNTAGPNGYGGAIWNNNTGTATVTNSTFSGNTATGGTVMSGNGGAIASRYTSTVITIVNSTFTGNQITDPFNSESGVGGAIMVLGTGTIQNSTIVGNSQTGTAVFDWTGGLYCYCTVTNTILAGNTAASGVMPDIGGTFTGTHNLIGNGADLSPSNLNGNIVGTSGNPINPQLGPLANNGGPTPTMLPGGNSPALAAGSTSGASATDQRGFPRVVNGQVDIGAVQLQGVAISATSGTPQSTALDTAFAAALTASATENTSGAAIPGVAVTFTAPSTGASGTFSNSTNTITAATGVNGQISESFTANSIVGGPYNVTASGTTGDQASASSVNFALTNVAGTATHFTASAPSTATAGAAFNVTVTAFDAFNNVATGYTGTVHFTSTDASATLPANAMLTGGTGTFSATLATSGSRTITATDTVTGAITGTSSAIAVSAAAATHFAVSAPSTVTETAPFNVTVTALDQFNNTAVGYAGTVHFTSTDGVATLPVNSRLTNGSGTFSVTLRSAGSFTITATDTVTSTITGTSSAIAAAGGAATHFVTSAPAAATAGVAFGVAVSALDALNNNATTYAGTIHFTSTDGAATLPANATLTNGTGTFVITLRTAGSQTFTATDTVTSSITGSSNAIAVASAPATHFVVSAPSTAAPNSNFSVTVTALDASNNTATSYAGAIHFTSTDGAATLPANSTLTNGTGTFSVTLNTAGSQTISVTDTVTSTITGTSGTINVPGTTALVVTNTNDSGTGSLRQAILAGNTSSGGATITFASGVTGTITLQSAFPQISRSLTITGPGASNLIIDGANLYQPFSIAQATVSISGVTIQHSLGGAIINILGTLNLSSCVLNANQSIASGNFTASGGAVYNNATLNVDKCTFTNNTAGSNGYGGAIANLGTATITNSTFSGNTATGGTYIGGDGGAIASDSAGALIVVNSTFTGNQITDPFNMQSSHGGAIYCTDTCTFQNSTITGNSQTGTANFDAAGGLYCFDTCTVTNTILAGNTAANGLWPDAGGSFTGTYNLIGNGAGTSLTNGVNGNIVGSAASPVNPLLGPLANNGGPTQTMLPGGNSPALAAGSTSGAPATDQRGFPRVVHGVMDIGAVQLQGVAVAATSGTPQTAGINTTFATALMATATEYTSNVAVPGVAVTFTAPSTGASGTFSNSTNTITASTGANGQVSETFAANSTTGGPYNVTASATTPDNASASNVNFALTNTGNSNAANHLSISAPSTATAGTSFSVTVTALDQNNNVATGYRGTVTFTTVDSGVGHVIPGNYTFQASDAGVHTFTNGVTLVSIGNKTVTATDTVTSSITGTSSAINVVAVQIVVTNTNDSGTGSLRQAIISSNSGAGSAAITFVNGVTGTITLASAYPEITQNVTITGPGASSLAIDGANLYQPFTINQGTTVAISGLTIQHGLDTVAGGGAILNFGNLTLSSCVLNANQSSDGGAILSESTGTLAVSQCTISNNTAASGGGIESFGPTTITNSTFAGNVAAGSAKGSGEGGAIFFAGAFQTPTPLTIINSTFSGNQAADPNNFGVASGGAIAAVVNTTLTIQNSTISGNSQTGVFNQDSGGGIYCASQNVTCTLTNTILAGNSDAHSLAPDGSGAINGSNNLIGNSTGIFGLSNGVNGNIVGFNGSPVSAALSPLANNGGPFQTMLPNGNSPALGAGTTAGAPATDQRGFARVTNGKIDIGAVQMQGVTISATGGTPQSASAGTIFATPLTATATESCGSCSATVPGVSVTFTAPSTGASGTFSNSTNTITAATAANGQVSETFTANTTVGGPYNVAASGTTPDQASAATANFALSNTAVPILHFTVTAPSTATAGAAFNITVTALDGSNNVATGYSGTVHFTSTDVSASLPANATLTNGAGTFSATLSTAGSRTITATDTVNTTITGASSSILVVAGTATHLTVTGPAAATAGAAVSITVTALDTFNNVATGYRGTVRFTKSEPILLGTVPGNYTFQVSDNGVHTFSNGVTFDASGTQTVTATDTVTSTITGTSNTITVSAGAAGRLQVTAPSTASPGTAFNVTVTALDAFNNVATSYTGTVRFTSSDVAATLPSNSTLNSGAGTFPVTLKFAGSQTITATDTVTSSITGTSSAVAVNAGAATHFSLSTPAIATAGAAFSVTVTALDQFNNTAIGYTGTVHFTSTDGAASLPSNSTLSHGVGTFSVTLNTSGSRTITAGDTVSGLITGTSSTIAVSAASGVHLQVSAVSTATAGTPFNITVAAFDQFGNTAANYTGTVHFTSSDGAASLPGNSTLTNGVGTFSVILKTAGLQTVGANDTVTSAITGTSSSIAVSAASFANLQVTAPSTAAAGVAFNITVTAVDPFGNTVTSYTGTVHFTSSDASATLVSNSTLSSGAGIFPVTLRSSGSQTITATDTVTSSITGKSNAITVTQTNLPPTINLVSPSTIAAGSAAFTLRVYGSNFAPNSVVQWGGSARVTTFGSPQQLSATINAADIAAAGPVAVTVFTPAPGGGTSSPITFTVGSSVQGTLTAQSVNGSPGAPAAIPVVLNLNSGATVGALSFGVQLTPVNMAPAIAASTAFRSDAALPVASGSPTITATNANVGVFYGSFTASLTGQVAIGVIQVVIPPAATVGQTYNVHITAADAAQSGTAVPLSAGADATVTLVVGYLVGDSYPHTADTAGSFGDGLLNTLDLIDVLRAVTNISTPATCSDRFDAMDASPVDTTMQRGGDGRLNTLDLIETLRRVTVLDASRPQRAPRGLTCSQIEAESRRPPVEGAADGSIEVQGNAIYLVAHRDLNLKGLAVSFRLPEGQQANFTPGETPASIVDVGQPGKIALAWLSGKSNGTSNDITLSSGQRLLLGSVDGLDRGALLGVSANDLGGEEVRIVGGAVRVR